MHFIKVYSALFYFAFQDHVNYSYVEYFKKLYMTMKLEGFVTCRRRRNDVNTFKQPQGWIAILDFMIFNKGQETTQTGS